MADGHGGTRPGAGRPKGVMNRRTSEAIDAVAERFPEWSPLLHMAAVANDTSLPADLRLDAAKAAAPYVHARPRPVEMEPEAVIAYEAALAGAVARARLSAEVDVVEQRPGLAERLERARRRLEEGATIVVATGVPRAPDEGSTS